MEGGITVVVPTWNFARRDHLARCLTAIERQTTRPAETVVVVDHNEKLLRWARRSFPEATVIANRHKRGVVGNRNTGIEAAQGEFIVLTDDDTEAEPDWIAQLTSCFSDPSVVGVTGELVPLWATAKPRWFPHEFYWVFGCSYAGLPTEPKPVRNPIAANMAVRREAVQDVGGFREGATPRELRHRGTVVAGGHALEDTELGIRIGRSRPQMKWLYQPHATVHHAVEPEQATLGYLVRRSFEEGAAKAVLAQTVGAEQGLASERRHLLIAIPRGVLRGLHDLIHGDPWGAARTATIALGILATGSGYAFTSLRLRAASVAGRT